MQLLHAADLLDVNTLFTKNRSRNFKGCGARNAAVQINGATPTLQGLVAKRLYGTKGKLRIIYASPPVLYNPGSRASDFASKSSVLYIKPIATLEIKQLMLYFDSK